MKYVVVLYPWVCFNVFVLVAYCSNSVLLFCLSSSLYLLQLRNVSWCNPVNPVAHPFTHVTRLFPSNQSAVLKHNTVNFGMLCSGGYAAPHASRSMTINFYNNMNKHENQTTQWLPLPNVSMNQKTQKQSQCRWTLSHSFDTGSVLHIYYFARIKA